MVRAGPRERGRLPVAIDRDDQPESPGTAGFDAGDGILHHDSPRRRHAEHARRVGEGIGCGFAGQPVACGNLTVDPQFEQVGEPGGIQDDLTATTRGDHGGAHAVAKQVPHHGQRAVVHLDPLAGQQVAEHRVLSVAETADGFHAWRIVWYTVVQRDAARAEEGSDPVVARTAVDEARVVPRHHEWVERLVARGRPTAQVVVEHPFPRRGVEFGGGGEYAVEVEEYRFVRGPVDHEQESDRRRIRSIGRTAGLLEPPPQTCEASAGRGQATPVPPRPQ